MTGKPRRKEYAEQSRVAIVAAAIDRFTFAGFSATTMDDVATHARMAKGGVYHHFASKAELFEAAFGALEERLLMQLFDLTKDAADPLDELSVGIDLFFAFCQRDDFRRIVLEEGPAALGWARWKALEEQYFLGAISSVVQGLAESGYTFVSVDMTSRLLLAALDEAGLLVAKSPHPHAEARRARDTMLAMLDGSRPKR